MKHPRLRSGFPFLFALPLAALPPACGGDGGSSSNPSSAPTLALALTDAASDEVQSFVVRIQGLELTRSSGSDMAILETPIDVDLVELAGTNLLVRTLAVPPGTYTGASIALDLDHATCVLVGESAPADVVDDQGQALAGTWTVPVQFVAPIHIDGSGQSLLQLEFDLDTSLVADGGANTAVFTPVIVLRHDPPQPIAIAALGTLASVDQPGLRFVVRLRDADGAAIADVHCRCDAATVFQVDGLASTGASGLHALAGFSSGKWLQAHGTLASPASTLDVTFVSAGIGTWHGGTDIVEGHVLDRAGGAGTDPLLTVRGQSSNADHSVFQYDTTFLVAGSLAGTHVVQPGSAQVLDTDDVGIGQRVRVFGVLAGTALDATAGVLRLEPTKIHGSASGAPDAGELTLDVLQVGPGSEKDYSWANGGTSPVDPDALVATVGTLAEGQGIEGGTPVILRGNFSPLDDSGPGFVATSVENAVSAKALLLVQNRLRTGFDVALDCSATGIELSITGSPVPGEIARVDLGPLGKLPLPVFPAPRIVPDGTLGLYVLRDHTLGPVTLYVSFQVFSAAVEALLAQGAEVRHLGAVGSYEAGINTLHATMAIVQVQ